SRPPKTSKPHAPSLLFLLVHRAGRSCKNTVLPCHNKAQKAQKQFIRESALSDLLFCVFCAFLWLNKSLEPQIVSVGCDVAIVALSLSMQSKGRWTAIPEELHKPIDQALAVIKTTKIEQAARTFAAFLVGPQGRAIMQKYGFTLPQKGTKSTKTVH